MKPFFTILFLILFTSSKILQSKKTVETKHSKNLKVQPKAYSPKVERKLYYYVDTADKKNQSKKEADNKRKLQQATSKPDPKLHLNKSFVVSPKQMEKVRKIHQNSKNLKVVDSKKNTHKTSRALQQAESDGDQENQKLQSTPLLLIGNYEIIVEKKDED